jgi:tRNA threonylcarbamoyladenosine biosynthesis protein TsaE
VLLPFTKIAENETDTSNIASEFARQLKSGDTICLDGNLGSGKTFFVKSVCNYFGIDTASSPSFGIVNEYLANQKIIHLDFYRLKKIEELYDIGFDDYLSSGDSIVFIEWGNMFQEILPKKYFLIKFVVVDETKREITITKHE